MWRKKHQDKTGKQNKWATPIDEIQEQVRSRPLEIPGFSRGTTIKVMVRPVVLLDYVLGDLGKPFWGILRSHGSRAKTPDECQRDFDSLGFKGKKAFWALVDTVVRDALESPTWDEITFVRPLSEVQKIRIFNKATDSNVALMGPLGGETK